jgi:hypothetical protein
MATYNDLTVLSADQLVDMIKTELGSCLDMIGNNEHALRALSAAMQLGERISHLGDAVQCDAISPSTGARCVRPSHVQMHAAGLGDEWPRRI